ncbi:MAG: hypothetical protein ACP6IP_09105 [Candidatus Njordarchaeia archaeon]
MLDDELVNDLSLLLISHFSSSDPYGTLLNLIMLLEAYILSNRKLPVIGKKVLRFIHDNSDIFCNNITDLVNVAVRTGVVREVFNFLKGIKCDFIKIVREFVASMYEHRYGECPFEEISQYYDIYKTYMLILSEKASIEDILSKKDNWLKYDLLHHLVLYHKKFLSTIRGYISKNWKEIINNLKKEGYTGLFYLYKVLSVIGDRRTPILRKILEKELSLEKIITVYAFYLVYLVRIGKIRRALSFIKNRGKIGSFVVPMAVKILAEMKLHKEAYIIAKSLQDVVAHTITLSIIAEALINREEYDKAVLYAKLHLDLLHKYYLNLEDLSLVAEFGPEIQYMQNLDPETIVSDGIFMLLDAGKYDLALKYAYIFCDSYKNFCEFYRTIKAFSLFVNGNYKKAIKIAQQNIRELDLLELIKWYMPMEEARKVLEFILNQDPKLFQNRLLPFALEYYGRLTGDEEKVLKYVENILKKSNGLEEKIIAIESAIKITKEKKLLKKNWRIDLEAPEK